MPTVEVKAQFKNINIKDKTVLQFELSPSYTDRIPDLTKLANRGVVLTIDDEQAELPLEELELEAEYEEPPTIPIEDILQEEQADYEDVVEAPQLPGSALPETEISARNTKEEIIVYAKEHGYDVDDSMTKAEMLDVIFGGGTDEDN